MADETERKRSGKARRVKGGRKPDDLRGEFTVVAVPGTHRDNTKRRYGGRGKRELPKAEKQKLLLEARTRGLSWREAGKVAGYRSVSAAYDAGQEAIADIPREAANEARALEMQRIDEIVRANWHNMQMGDPEAGNLILRAIDRRAKLLGLDLQEPVAPMLDLSLQALIVRLVGLDTAEVESELSERLKLLQADEEDDQRAAARNGHGNGTSRQAARRALA